MVTVSAEGSRAGKVPSTPLRLGRFRRDDGSVVAPSRRILDHIAGTFLELPVSYQTAICGLILCRAGSNEFSSRQREEVSQRPGYEMSFLSTTRDSRGPFAIVLYLYVNNFAGALAIFLPNRSTKYHKISRCLVDGMVLKSVCG